MSTKRKMEYRGRQTVCGSCGCKAMQRTGGILVCGECYSKLTGKESKLEPQGTKEGTYMHESLRDDAVAYDLDSEQIIEALATDNKTLKETIDSLQEQLTAQAKEITIQAEQIELIENQCQKNGRDAANRKAEIEQLKGLLGEAEPIVRHTYRSDDIGPRSLPERIEQALKATLTS